MKGCTGLEQTPESIGGLSCLQQLDLSHCDSLINLQMDISEKTVLPENGLRRRLQIILSLPRAVKKITYLANLSIDGKIHIGLWHLKGNAEHLSFISEQQIPEDIGLLQSLEKLDLSGNDFTNLPTSMKNLSKLKDARLSNCIKLEALPGLTQLQTLKLSGCSNLKSLLEPSHAVQEMGRYKLLELELDNCHNVQTLSHQLDQFTSLTYLDLSSNDFEAIPESITYLISLETLCLSNCKKLKSVEELPLSLQHLSAHGCDSLENVALSPKHVIKHLDLSHCFSLQQDEQLITRFLDGGYSSQEVSQRFVCLPGTTVPRYFDNRSSGTSAKISLPLIRTTHTHLDFGACIMISCESSFYLQFPAFSYDWSCEDDEVIRINLKPKLYHGSETEEEETVPSHHLVIIHVPSTINTERIEALRLESHLHLPDNFRLSPGEIRACGIHMITQDR